MKNNLKLILGLILFLLLLLGVLLLKFEFDRSVRITYADFVVAATAIIIFFYTRETYKLRKEAVEANMFATFTKIHERLSNWRSYRIRGCLHEGFCEHMVEVSKHFWPDLDICAVDKFGVERVNVKKVLKNLKEDEKMKSRFDEGLDAYFTSIDGVRALEVVECTLLDLDVIALPLYMKINSVREVMEAYRSVIESTATEILPFVAIQKKLRGSKEPEYKKHYLHLLKELKIHLDEVNLLIPDKR